MIMAQIITLTDRKTGEAVYPVTSTKAVFDEKGEDLDTLLAAQKQETEAALKDYAKKTDLSGKQDALTDSLDVKVSGTALTITERAKRAVFDDLFLAAAGTWGKIDYSHFEDGVSKPYYLNELWLTYEEAVEIFKAYISLDNNEPWFGNFKKIRTHLPFGRNYSTALGQTFHGCTAIEIVRITFVPSGSYATFMRCSKLRKVTAITEGNRFPTSKDFSGCVALEDLLIQRIAVNLYIQDCPLVNAASFRYMIQYAKNTAAITFYVHPDVYAKLTSAVDDPDDEWYGLIDLAAAKQITFACA